MCGWFSDAMARASRSKRARRSGEAGNLLAQDLDGDGTVEPRVPRVVHLSHAAGAERADDLVGSEAGAWDQWHSECLRSRDYIPAPLRFRHGAVPSA